MKHARVLVPRMDRTSSSSVRAWLFALAIIALPSSSLAASRGQYGGTLRVAVAGEHPSNDPLLADSPSDAALLALTTRAVCKLDRERQVVPTLAVDLQRESPTQVRIGVRPALRSAGGHAVNAQSVARAWMRLNQSETRTPYRALLFPLRGEGKYLAPGSANTLPLTLAFPWPDLERTLCHPTLAVPSAATNTTSLEPGVGPLLPTRALGVYVANWSFALGRPYVERITTTTGDVRSSARLLALGEAEVGIGTTAEGLVSAPPTPALYATYLAFNPARTDAGFGNDVESVVDRSDLTRFFVRAPSVAMSSLLPPALMPQVTPARPSRRTTQPARREVVLLYDLSVPDQRSVAERLQVKLHDVGYRVALRGLSRSALRAKWASGDFDLMLHAVLLPPVPAPALAVVLDVAGRHDLLSKELPPLGALTDDKERDARTRERALELQPDLRIVPLYAQGTRLVHAAKITGLDFDAHGIPLLDDAFFQGAP